jgi:hypothetical protein
VTLIIVDVNPALLTWEGRDAYGAEASPRAHDTLDELFGRFRLVAVTDGNIAATEVRRAVESTGLEGFFENVGTTALYGPFLTPRVVRRIAAEGGVRITEVILVTAREQIAEAMRAARIAVILTEGPAGFASVPEAIDEITDGPFSL